MAHFFPADAQMIPVIEELSQSYAFKSDATSSVVFVSVEADGEAVATFSELSDIKIIPSVLCVLDKVVVGSVEGFNIPAVVSTVADCHRMISTAVGSVTAAKTAGDETKSAASSAPAAAAAPAKPAAAAAAPAPFELTDELKVRLNALVASSPVMLFMKGAPDAPRCGFSRQVVEILKGQKVRHNRLISARRLVHYSVLIVMICPSLSVLASLVSPMFVQVKFGSFDILSDNAVREGLKKLSNWPTYPQLYADGKLVGGLDVIKGLIEEGDFQDQLPAGAIVE